MLLADNLGELNKKTALGIAMALMGSLIRWDIFYAVGGLSSVLLVYKFFNLDINGKKKAVVTMVILFIVTFSAKAVDVLAYKMDPRWDEFARYNVKIDDDTENYSGAYLMNVGLEFEMGGTLESKIVVIDKAE